MFGDVEVNEAGPASMFVAPRGQRHGFRNPFGDQARILGIWAPAAPAIDFMREIYAKHASRLLT